MQIGGSFVHYPARKTVGCQRMAQPIEPGTHTQNLLYGKTCSWTTVYWCIWIIMDSWGFEQDFVGRRWRIDKLSGNGLALIFFFIRGSVSHIMKFWGWFSSRLRHSCSQRNTRLCPTGGVFLFQTSSMSNFLASHGARHVKTLTFCLMAISMAIGQGSEELQRVTYFEGSHLGVQEKSGTQLNNLEILCFKHRFFSY